MKFLISLTVLVLCSLALLGCGSGEERTAKKSAATESGSEAGVETAARPEADEESENKEESSMTDAKRISSTGYDLTPPDEATMAMLHDQLDELARSVTCEAGTERPGTGVLLHNKADGVYVCVVCKLPLFKSGTKFESGTGWPSFYQPFDKQHVTEILDRSHGMTRVENTCARCGAHLGHLFTDGPKPTGLRYCMNSAALEFYGKDEKLPEMPRAR